MRIAFIDHSFHQKTRSSRFLLEILEASWDVDLILDHSWDPNTPAKETHFDPEAYDAVIIYQAHEFFKKLTKPHPNITFIPMYDAMVWRNQFYWRPQFNQAKVVSFSWMLHEEVQRRNPCGLHVQYYPDPSAHQPIVDVDGLRAFFWYRVRDIGVDTVFDLCRAHAVDRLTIHNVPDPNHGAGPAPPRPAHIRDLVLTDWFPSAADYLAMVRGHNVYFAPRPLEGIGMSFLEAMALGQCVVAPDAPTMNEYIAHGATGLLYPLGVMPCAPLDLSRAREMGRRARDSVERGYGRWQASLPQLLDFIATPRNRLTRTATSWRAAVPPVTAARGGTNLSSPAGGSWPLVSVVTVTLNGGAALEATLDNVLAQTGIPFEAVVLDGGSTDGSAERLARYANRLGYWHSGPDGGIYDAMNRAVAQCRGEWVLFMNVGDAFVDETALARMFARVPDDADVVYGHHIHRDANGVDQFRPANDFESTWTRLTRGALGYDWLARIPAHQATAVRRSLLARLGFDTRYRLAADHDLLFRARRGGARFFHCDEVIALYSGAGRSAQQFDRCRQEWAEIARTHGDPAGAQRFFAEMAVHNSTAVKSAQRLVSVGLAFLQRLHPGLGARASQVLHHPEIKAAIRRALKGMSALARRPGRLDKGRG